ncbi:MAG: D-alanyl-D-alanine carboxypeptidase family protein [Alphaproteobacteria bacterium]
MIALRKKYTIITSVVLFIVYVCILNIFNLNKASAVSFQTSAKHVILMDYDTGSILYEKAADDAMFPASMSKIMTALIVFDRLKEGSLTLSTKIPVSEKAWRMGGSKMFVRAGRKVTVQDLLRGVIVQSGNDASIVLAEAIGGDEKTFAEMMTKRGKEIGLQNSNFKNATGWPDPDHITTARDLAKLANYIIKEYPEYYKYYSEKKFTYGKSPDGKPITQGNRNPLLYYDIGADGLKTGYINSSGYGLTASGMRNDRRLTMVIHGMGNVRTRTTESRRLYEWGFREFDNITLFKANETVDSAKVWLGDKSEVSLVLKNDLRITIPIENKKNMKVSVKYLGPISTPIVKGQKIGSLVINGTGTLPITKPLFAAEDIGQLNFIGRIVSAISYIIFGAPEN